MSLSSSTLKCSKAIIRHSADIKPLLQILGDFSKESGENSIPRKSPKNQVRLQTR